MRDQLPEKGVVVVLRGFGGMGDILSGLTAGLLTKHNSLNASILGVYLNGVAASLAYKRVGLHMLASDVIEDLPKAMKPFDLIKT